MKVADLRAAIRAHDVTDDQGIHRMPNGDLVSKARQADLTAYLADLNTATEVIEMADNGQPETVELANTVTEVVEMADNGPTTDTVVPAKVQPRVKPMAHRIGHKRKLEAKYARRRQSPNNVRLRNKYRRQAESLEAEQAHREAA
jgi:hypothetical protein|tara:strand:+ start:4665 stop:5099 length:435 start_codon:yes stop_codon:yes gene_type:complete